MATRAKILGHLAFSRLYHLQLLLLGIFERRAEACCVRLYGVDVCSEGEDDVGVADCREIAY